MAQFSRVAICVMAVLAVAAATVGTGQALLRDPKWRSTGSRAPADARHTVFVSLPQSNLDLLEKRFWEVSNPTHPDYAQYLSTEDITKIVAPAPHVTQNVMNWLESCGAAVEILANQDVMIGRMSVAQAEACFKVELHQFQHEHTGRVVHRALRTPHIPVSVKPHVALLQGVEDFPMPTRTTVRTSAQSLRNAAVTAKPQSTPNGAPVVSAAMSGGGDQILVQFTPTCVSSVSTASIPPCSDHPPALTTVTVTATAIYNNMASFSKTLAPQCSISNGQVGCQVMLAATYYDNYNVTITANFGSTAGATVVYPFPVVVTPAITPQSLDALYGIPTSTVARNGTQAVVEFEQQYYSPNDLQMFFQEMGIIGADTPVNVVGFNNASNPGGEANLDIQYIMGVARGVPTTFWSIYANSTIEIDDILKWEYAMGNTTNPPLVNSISYGMTEDHVDRYLGAGYLARSDVEFQKLALRGITVIIACGDTGAGDLGAPPMSQTTCKTMHPDWPSQSPYVTAVGSTYVTPNAEPICYMPAANGGIDCSQQPLGEVVVSMDQGLFWTTGGGFSWVTQRPSYQDAFVEAYLKHSNLQPPSSMFNASGRAYPDVVAVGHNLMVVIDGLAQPVDGTSASAPIFAGVVSLLNSARLDRGMPALGFLNPFLYHVGATNPAAFYDLSVGNNRCGAIDWNPACCVAGFQAAPGWDAASGLGSPNYPVLLEEALMYGAKAVRA